MTPHALGDPHRSVHQKILEKEQVKAYHVVDMFPRYQCILDLTLVGIDR